MARLSQERKNELMKELQDTFGLYEGIFATKKPDYPTDPLVYKGIDGKFSVIFNKSPEYDYRIPLPRGRLFIKIFISPRDFESREAIGSHYQKYLEKSESILKSYATDDDLWFTFVKTPSGWVWYLSPLSHHQELQIDTTIRRARRRMRSVNNKRAILDKPPLEMSIMIPFLAEWIIFNKPLYGLHL